jgi:hypothetical protein
MGAECDLTCSEIEARGLRVARTVCEKVIAPIPPLTRHSLSAGHRLRARHDLGCRRWPRVGTSINVEGGGCQEDLAWVLSGQAHCPPRRPLPPRPTSPDIGLCRSVSSHVHMMILR